MLSTISMLVKASQTIRSKNRTKELNNKSSIRKKCLGKELFNFFYFYLVPLIRHTAWGGGEVFSRSLE